MGIKCFMIEPVYGDPIPEEARSGKYSTGWPPFNYILRWRRPDTGEEYESCSDFGVGAMWRAIWYWKNLTWDDETEPHLIVACPTRDWDIDSRCLNCGLPEDKVHRCWVRHGEPPNITVDKAGVTCSAGSGSIDLPAWHGFLRKGELVSV